MIRMLYGLLSLAGILLVAWGLPTAHRWPSPRNLVPALAVLLGTVAAILGILLTALPRFFLE